MDSLSPKHNLLEWKIIEAFLVTHTHTHTHTHTPKQGYSPSTLRVQARLLRSCLSLCDSMDYSLPGSSVQGILQAKILECVALPSSRASSWSRDQNCISYISCSDRRVLNCWATREVPSTLLPRYYWRYHQIQLENNKNHKN